LFIKKAVIWTIQRGYGMGEPGGLIRRVHGRGRVQIPERIRRIWGLKDGDLVVWIPPEAGQLEAKVWPGRVVRKEI